MKLFFYEILEQIDNAATKEEKKQILLNNNTPYFRQFLEYSFHPDIQFYPKKFPDNYVTPDTAPGISFSDLQSELRRVYLFQKGNLTAEAINEDKRNILLVQMLECFEPREAEILIRMFNKDLKTKGLTYKLVKEVFPNLLP